MRTWKNHQVEGRNAAVRAALFSVDLHVHTHLSGDSDADPEECVDRAIQRGLQGIVFTEHYSFRASEPIERLRESHGKAILILRGVEFSAAEGHCLVFGADTDRLVPSGAPVEELIEIVNRAGGVVVPSHPYRAGSGIGDRVLTLEGIAGIEGHNGCNLVAQNRRAIEAAQSRRLPVSGGSDAHRAGEVGSCLTVFPERVTEESFVAVLRAGNFGAVDLRKISRGW